MRSPARIGYYEHMKNDGVLLARGVCRFLRQAGFGTLTEFTLRNRRRVDVIALAEDGRIAVVEVKSSEADFRADTKWRDYLEFCDAFYFAVPEEFPRRLIPESCGLLVADGFGAEMLREPEEGRVNPARRKSLITRFARTASLRLQALTDPDSSFSGR